MFFIDKCTYFGKMYVMDVSTLMMRVLTCYGRVQIMKVNKKTVSKTLLGFYTAQALTVGCVLADSHLSPKREPEPVVTQETINYCRDKCLYGIISNSVTGYPAEPLGNEPRELNIYLAAATTGTSGDSVVLSIPV